MRRAIVVSSLLLVMAAGHAGAAAKNSDLEKVDRKPFCRAVRDTVSAQQHRKWDRMYEMLWPALRKNKAQADYVSNHSERWSLRDFKIGAVRAQVPVGGTPRNGRWEVTGCARIKDEHGRRDANGIMTVYLEKDDWYVSEVQVTLPLVGGIAPHCSDSQFYSLADFC